MPDRTTVPPVSRSHLDELTGTFGIMQHAVGSRPDPAHGYCTDDIARALTVDLLHQRVLGWEAVAGSAWRSLDYLLDAYESSTGRFRNFRRVDGSWLEGVGSEDANGRAMLALGQAMADARDEAFAEAAGELFARALPAAMGMGALRAQAAVLLGCDAAIERRPTGSIGRAHRLLAGRLRARFDMRAAAAWPWPEPTLTYENALPVQALLVAGRRLRSPEMTGRGLAVLDWLLAVQTAPAGHLSPIGNGWWHSGGEAARFDQQPIEATSLLLAAEAAYDLTGDRRYRAAMERSYDWFLGRNDLGLAVADPLRGAACDGLTPDGVNTNEGAESTLMWLIALEHVRALALHPSTAASTARTTGVLAATAL